MGLERTPNELNARALQTEALRLYDKYELRAILLDAGFRVESVSGCFLKPLPNKQMEDWSDELLRAFLLVGDELGDYCKELIAIAEWR
jgi:hypothetical protein